MTSAVMPAPSSPVMSGGVRKAASSVCAIVCVCVMQPIPKDAATQHTANPPASHGILSPYRR